MSELFHRIPFLRILAFYLGGIIISKILNLPFSVFWYGILCLTLLITIILVIKRSIIYMAVVSSFGFLTILGIIRFSEFNSKQMLIKGTTYVASILEYPIKKQKSFKVQAKLREVVTETSFVPAKEKIILYFEPDSLAEGLQPGDFIIFKVPLQEISNPGNPFEFDFKKYMATKKIFRQVYLASGKWEKTGSEAGINLKIIAEKTRHKLLDIYLKNHIEDEKFAILSALTLGYQDALDPETKQVFSSTGTTHVLSVSGLHVGIVFIAINFIFGFLRRSKKGKPVFLAVSIILLWGFAFITGLSAAVLRATVMFCFLVIGENIRRPADIYNTLASSAFILLFINPNLIFDIGFQLSYLAVWGIVFFQPKIENLLSFDTRIMRWAWSLMAVSIAAQLATFPLTIYYFSQFPTYFWAANFIIIPASTLFIFTGIAILLTSYFPLISSLLSDATSFLLDWVYFILGKFQDLPLAVVRNIHVSNSQFILLSSGIIVLALFIWKKKPGFLHAGIAILFLVLILNVSEKIRFTRENEIIVYNSGGGKLIHLISGFRNYVLFENTSQLFSFDMNSIENERTNRHLQAASFIQLDSTYEDSFLFLKRGVIGFMGKTILIGKKGDSKYPEVDPDFVVTEGQFSGNIPGGTKIINTKNFYNRESESDDDFNVKKAGAFIYKF